MTLIIVDTIKSERRKLSNGLKITEFELEEAQTGKDPP